MPLEHALDLSQELYVTRTSATLHLMLYQVSSVLHLSAVQAVLMTTAR